MALVLADRVLETTTTAGSGTITLAGAEPGYQSFSAVGDGNQTYYTIAGDTEWEVGIGTYTASGTTLSRDTVLSSSNSGAKITFSAGVKKVFVTYPSEKSVNLDVSGNISLSSAVISGVASPTADSDAATKLYVDTLAAQGITYHSPVKYEVPNSTGNLTATYNNGTAGVSATLTNAGTLAAFVPDGVTASISDRVLVYNQTNGFENGVYTVTVVGSGATSWVLTRATDADTYALKSPNSLGGGDAFYVTSGNTGAGETYLCNNSGVISFGSTAISFVQISAAQVYSAGNGLSLTNTVFSLATPVAVGNGGTGSSATPGNGELLIGNGSGYTLATLTAGSGVSITNSAGSITLSATGLGGTVTAVTATGPLASSGGTTPDISIANSTGTGSVVLDQGATISSATITAALSASITTITGTSANITTVTGTTTTFSSGTISQLGATSATVTTLSGTNVTYSSGTVSQLAATSATIATVSGTNATYSNGSFTSATVTNVSGTNLSYGSATITTGNLTFSGTGQRITGDMSNATPTSRLAFQSSTTNGNTVVQFIPNGTATQTNLLLYANTDLSNSAALNIFQNATESTIRAILLGTGSYTPLTFQVGGSERMRLDTSGNLGIGTASPSTMLHLSGSAAASKDPTITLANTTATTGRTYQLVSGDGGPFRIYDVTAAVDRMRIDSSGNVGIGTASPVAGYRLNVVNDSGNAQQLIRAGTNFNSTIAFGDQDSSTSGQLIYAHNGDYMAFNTNAAERMRIDSSGNVGIGTASPASLLDLTGNDPTLRLTDNAGSPTRTWSIRSSDGNYIVRDVTGGADRFQIGSSGQIGIGGANYGTAGQVLTSNGSGSAPSWQTAGGSSLKSQTFTSSGTFTVPTGVTSVWVTMIGGGSSGCVQDFGPVGGASGAYCFKRPFSVTAGASLTVTIGGGGAGTATATGNDGSATSFSSLTVSGGLAAITTGGRLGIGGSNGGSANGQNSGFIAAGSSLLGGRGGAWSLNTYISGGGGGGFGDGTAGATSNSSSAAANSGAGSGGCRNGTTGAGGSGMVIVEWLG